MLSACASTEGEKSNAIRTGNIRIGNSSVFYQRSGQGEAVFLAHAGFQDHEMWEEQRKALTKAGYEVIAIDLPGHGRSSAADTNVLLQEVIRICLDTLGVQKASMVGLSLGGATVTDFALAYPQRVNKLVLVSALATGYDTKYPVDSFTRSYFPNLKAALDKNDLAAAAEVFTKYWADGIRKPTETDSSVRGYVYRTTLLSLQNHGYMQWGRFNDNPGIDRLDQLQMPVLIIYGDKDLQVIRDAAPILSGKIKNSKVVSFKNVAHMLNMEIPSAFNETLLAFLKQ
jgi:3-oxoadipate enol-lactonase